jgi:putative phosphoesterase
MRHIGLISDTHGLLRPEALAALAGCDHIIHAGDICNPEILSELAAIAPVTAVRGNNDQGAWALALQEVEILHIEQTTIYVIHDLKQLRCAPQALGVQVVVAGHSHRPQCEQRDGVLVINPGSAGPRRFKLPVSVARLEVDGARVTAHIQELA